MLARAAIVGLALCVAGTPDAASDDHGRAQDADIYPLSSSRMYDAPRAAVWNAVVELLEQRGFNYARFDHTRGVIITESRKLRWKKFPGLEPFEAPEGYTPFRFELFIFVPQKVPVARLHINSIVESRRGSATRFAFDSGHIERAIFSEVEKSIQATPIAIPSDHAARRALTSEISGDAKCRDAPALQTWFGASPVLIQESKVRPIYPGNDARAQREGQILLRVLVDEAGVAIRREFPRNSAPRTEFEVAAWYAVGFWRFEPAMRDGCPVGGYSSASIDFRMR